MIKLNRKPVEVREDEVIVGGWKYQRQTGPLQTRTAISPKDYALVFIGDEANSALSTQQQLNGLAFDPMVRESFKKGLPLARVRDFTPLHRNVNLALQSKGVLYDAAGDLIERKRLIEVGKAVNGAWIYLNDAYEESDSKDKGFLGLDLVHVTGFDREKPILERRPLEECVVNCWADTESVNNQGYSSCRRHAARN